MKTLLIILLITTSLLAQKQALLKADNQLHPLSKTELKKIKTSPLLKQATKKIAPYEQGLEGVSGVLDTLRYAPEDDPQWNSNFGFFGQDVIVQWFQAPADMFIRGVGFNIAEAAGQQISVKLVSMNWNQEQIMNAGVSMLGYYPAPGNGFNDAEPFTENDHSVEVGDWFNAAGNANGELFGPDIWSDEGSGAIITVDAEGEYWVDTEQLGFLPEIANGDIFGVAVKNDFTTMDSSRIGLRASTSIGVPGFKYYANGRYSQGIGKPDTASIGWWSREFTFDMSLAVELLSGPRIVISDMTILKTTLSTEPRTVTATITDDNPSGGEAGISSAIICYSVDNGQTWQEVPMTSNGNGLWSGEIPGQQPGMEICYYIEATSIQAYSFGSQSVCYRIFDPQSPLLVVYDANDFAISIVKTVYMAGADSFSNFDTWQGYDGPISSNLLQYYKNVVHLMGSYPANAIDSTGRLYKNWLDQASSQNPRNLFISGQDYGYISGFADTTFQPGSFERDYLGIETLGPQDVSWDSTNASIESAYPIVPVADDPLSGWITQYNSDSTVFVNDPHFNLGFYNWIDNMTLDQSSPVFTDGKTGLPVACRNEGSGWKTTFWTVDPLALAFNHKTDSSQVIWLRDKQNPLLPALSWFGFRPTAMEDIKSKNMPYEFALAQNYPNPFNPTTTIEYTVGTNNHSPLQVSLKIYDVLGREVKTLVNEKQPFGQYRVTFDASGLVSGIYYYRLETGDFVQSRKMLLLR